MSAGETISAVMICIAVATLCFTVSRVYIYTGWSFMVTVLLMLVVSSLVRVIERFSFTETFFDKDGDYFGVIVGCEISLAWICSLLAEWITAMKYFDVSSQIPAIVVGGKPVNSIDPKATSLARTLGCVANVLVSVWPGFLLACTYY